MSWAIVIGMEPETVVYVLKTKRKAEAYAREWIFDRLRMLIDEAENEDERDEIQSVRVAFNDMPLDEMFLYDEFNEYTSVDSFEIVEVST